MKKVDILINLFTDFLGLVDVNYNYSIIHINYPKIGENLNN